MPTATYPAPAFDVVVRARRPQALTEQSEKASEPIWSKPDGSINCCEDGSHAWGQSKAWKVLRMKRMPWSGRRCRSWGRQVLALTRGGCGGDWKSAGESGTLFVANLFMLWRSEVPPKINGWKWIVVNLFDYQLRSNTFFKHGSQWKLKLQCCSDALWAFDACRSRNSKPPRSVCCVQAHHLAAYVWIQPVTSAWLWCFLTHLRSVHTKQHENQYSW